MLRKIMITLLIVLSLISLFIGNVTIRITDLFTLSEVERTIFLVGRVPRLISVLVTGAGMSISGLIMQQITRNKFVAPSTAVTVDAAKLGLVIATAFMTTRNLFGQMLVSFSFALIGTFLFMFLLRKIQFKNAIFIPLLGIMLGNIIDSVSTFLAYRLDMIQNINAWMVGSFTNIIQGRYELLYLTVPLLIIAYLYASKFTVAGMGEDFAKNLGLNYNLVVTIGLVIVALTTASVIITVGSIPFLGLIIPNIVSLYRGDNMKKTILDTGILGALFLLICDVIGRVIIFPYEISIGLTVGLFGSLIFIYLLQRRFRHEG